MDIQDEQEIKDYIEEQKENDPIAQLNTLAWEVWLWKEKEEWDEGPHLFDWLKNDEKLMQYAELQMQYAELSARKEIETGDNKLSLWEQIKMEVYKIKIELLEMRLSATCPYFKDFQTFLEWMKQRKDVGRNTETNTIIEPDYEDPDTPYPEIPPEIDDSDVEEIAHFASNWQTRRKWEKLVVDKEERKKFLFPDWLPKTKEEMESKYLVTIKVPILDWQWNTQEKELQVHKKLANSYIAVFKELVSNWIKVDGSVTWAYCRRKMRKWSKMSEHSYWTAIDINWSYNWGVYGKTDPNSIYYNNQTTVEIFKKYWFAWWWDRSDNYDDPMHFTYMWS